MRVSVGLCFCVCVCVCVCVCACECVCARMCVLQGQRRQTYILQDLTVTGIGIHLLYLDEFLCATLYSM